MLMPNLDRGDGRKLTKGTLKKYRVLLSQLKTFTATRGLAELSEISVDAARQFRESWDDGPISSMKKLERFRAFSRFCATAGWMRENPAEPLLIIDDFGMRKLPMAWALPACQL
jgi:site-specific recombinase XerD